MWLKWNYKIFDFLGAPVFVSTWFILVFAYFMIVKGVADGIIMSVCLLILMLIHEMGHAWFVRKYQHTLLGIQISLIHGCCYFEYDDEFEVETLVYAGGLLFQALLFLVTFNVFTVFKFFELNTLLSFFYPIFYVFIWLNILIFIINALPIKGFDGYVLWKRFGEFVGLKYKRLKPGSKPTKPRLNKQSVSKEVDEIIRRAIDSQTKQDK